MAQWLKAPATKPHDPSSVPRTHMVEGDTDSCKFSTHMFIPTLQTCTHKRNK